MAYKFFLKGGEIMQPQKFSNQLTKTDVIQWIRETFFFSIPFLVAVLTALGNGHNWSFAIGAGYSALATSLMNLYGKFKAGV